MTRQRPRRDDGDYWPLYMGVGTILHVGNPDQDRAHASGVIYVPDPEERRGWRPFYVPAKAEPKPGARPIGFGR